MEEEKGLGGLKIWQMAMQLAVKVCKEILPTLPVEEKWSLSSQLRRAIQSVPANIAEGYGRYYYQETIHFCYIARGSLMESFTFLRLAYQLGYISEPVYTQLEADLQTLLHSLNTYVQFLKRSKRGENEPGATSIIRESEAFYTPQVFEPASPDESIYDDQII